MTEKTFCDVCGAEIPDPRFDISLYDSDTETDLIDWDVCVKCKNRILPQIRRLAKQ